MSTRSTIAATTLFVVASLAAPAGAQDFDPSQCEQSCEARHEACIERCAEHDDPVECDSSCRDALEDCMDACE